MEGCVHVWKISEANGPTSQGVCQLCHVTKDFSNYVEAKGFGQGHRLNQPGHNDRFRVER
jgi:hypothetical protein